MENKNTNMAENILAKIKNEEVKMTSKQFFFMKWLTLLVTSLFFLALGLYLFAYIIFLFVDNGLMVIPFDSQSSVMKFIVEIPWSLVVLGVLSVFFFSITSKTFYKIYRKPFLTFFISVLMCVLISQIIFLETGGMKKFKQEAYGLGLHLAPAKLLQFRNSQTGNLFVGQVVSTSSNSIVILDRSGKVVELFFENPSILKTFLVGNKINAYVETVLDKSYVKSIGIID